ncbi:MAG: polysaccharide export protein [Verrucomicrobia bacterium]|nr:polysaccharide export protein [Verrucomicrobiota bacterium]
MKAYHYRRIFAVILTLGCLAAVGFAAEGSRRPEISGRETSDAGGGRFVSGSAADYILQPMDVLKVFVFQHDDLNKQMEAVQVSPEHTISLPLVQTIKLKGKTTRQAEQIIRDAFDRDYLVNPQVSVIVVKYAERSVNVLGQVGKPDRVLFPPEKGLTILEAITLAGGHTRLADLKKVKLTRKQENGDTEVMEIDVDALMKRGGRDAVQLQKDDVIFVPERIL